MMADLPHASNVSPPVGSLRMQRVRRLSAVMAVVCVVIAAALTLGLALYWWLTPVGAIFQQSGLPSVPPTELSMFVRGAGFAISMIPLAFLIYGLIAARRCFHSFAAGNIFSETAIASLRTLAIGMALSALTKPIAAAGLGLLLSSLPPGAGKTLSLHISADMILLLAFSGIVAIIAWVLMEATEIADEHRQFV